MGKVGDRVNPKGKGQDAPLLWIGRCLLDFLRKSMNFPSTWGFVG